MKGALAEVFSSIQGEGLHVGKRQVFLRLAGCN
ncbi:MAG: 7-carboxy-7-deazaguanine synthase QueE, partial [Pseudomonadota bacterium]